MILVDVNLLLDPVNADLEHHHAARRWWQETLSGTEPVGLPWVVVPAFLRLTSHPRVFERPLAVEQALAYVDEWLAQPVAYVVAPGPNHWPIPRNRLEATGSAGNLVTDAHIAAPALEHGYAVHSADNDFRRFPGSST